MNETNTGVKTSSTLKALEVLFGLLAIAIGIITSRPFIFGISTGVAILISNYWILGIK